MKLRTLLQYFQEKILTLAKSIVLFCWRKAKPWFDADKNLFLLVFLLAFVSFLNWQWQNLEFFLRANWLTFVFTFPFLFLFIWLYRRNSFGSRESFWTVISILTAVLFFLFQNVDKMATKGFEIYAAHQYNCSVAENIIALDQKENKSANFTLNYFVTEPYLTNVDLLFGNYDEATGRWLLVAIYKMQAANSLLTAVQSLNIQGVNLLNPNSGYFVDMYNKQVIEMAKEIKVNLPCSAGDKPRTFLNSLKDFFLGFWKRISLKIQTWFRTP